MKVLAVFMHQQGQRHRVGVLQVFVSRGKETYQFTYESDWIENGFNLDPNLLFLAAVPQTANRLWGAFQDIAPDRWGRLLQNRANPEAHLCDSDYLVGVSDAMRLGALRMSDEHAPDIFLAPHHEIPKLIHLGELQSSAARIEADDAQVGDIDLLLAPGSSLGGAYPKAVVSDGQDLYLAKFPSKNADGNTPRWEAVMLSLARRAGIRTAEYRLHETPVGTALLVKRFDRDDKQQRIHFASAMTLLGLSESNRDDADYVQLADVIKQHSLQPGEDLTELWRRMLFNMLAGNTDDHLRNHGFLRGDEGWRLSPAYDLTPTATPLAKRHHALAFIGHDTRPSLDTALHLGQYFGLGNATMQTIVKQVTDAIATWQTLATDYHIGRAERTMMRVSFENQ